VKWTELPEASQACYEIHMQERLQESMQVCEGSSTMYSIMPVWRTV